MPTQVEKIEFHRKLAALCSSISVYAVATANHAKQNALPIDQHQLNKLVALPENLAFYQELTEEAYAHVTHVTETSALDGFNMISQQLEQLHRLQHKQVPSDALEQQFNGIEPIYNDIERILVNAPDKVVPKVTTHDVNSYRKRKQKSRRVWRHKGLYEE